MSKTRDIEVRIEVAVAPDGSWAAYGTDNMTRGESQSVILDALDTEGYTLHTIVASVPLPVHQEIDGIVEYGNDDRRE